LLEGLCYPWYISQIFFFMVALHQRIHYCLFLLSTSSGFEFFDVLVTLEAAEIFDVISNGGL